MTRVSRVASRHRTTALIVGALAAAVVVVLALGTQDSGRTAPGDPDNAGPDGARAVARVLDDRGVDVAVARSADEVAELDLGEATTPAPPTTVVVTSTEQLGASTLDRLRRDAAGSRLVLVDPPPALLGLLGLDARSLDTRDPVAAGCADPTYDSLSIEVDSGRATSDGGCFDGALVERDGLVVLGAGELLTNDQVLRADNAAVALRLLGAGDRLVWYVADADDLVGDDAVGVASLLPDWLMPGLWLLGVAALAGMVWRGRRLGALATEPLPVIVKAIETTRSRGRLYHRAGDRAHAAAALRRATRSRLRERLRLGSSASDDALAREAARATGRPEGEVARLLGSGSSSGAAPPTPVDDRALITLAHDLAELDREVLRP